MAGVLKKDPASYAREKASFLRDLQHFHDTRGTPSRALPRIDGKEIDLYLLYVLVTAQGGWVKVNQRNDWKNLLENFGLLSSCVNAEVALKQIYLRYLDRYEKINFLGETGDIAGDDDEDSRHKKWSARALHSVPLVYNHHQHTVNETVRAFHGLSTNLYKASDYDKLSLSLLSPLPNEQDLAINVCILLSNENKHAIKLSKCPQILHHLLAHAGIFTHSASRKYWEDYYRKVRKWSIKTFWKEVLDEQELLYLTDESRFCARTPKTVSRKDDESSSCSDDDDDYKNNKVKLSFDPSDDELFGLKRPLGTDDPYGQRVYQVALILRNLTFFEENMKVMGQDLTFLRFVLLCCATRWNCLHQIGFEMLGNIGPVVPLDVGSLQHATLDIVCKNITESNDRSIILSAVEALNRMGSKESNEEFLLKNINQKVYDKICNMLSLHDIMLLIQTLECLYSLSSLGERACNAIVHVHGVIDTLVSLITVEAQTYGPKACILMRVIETVTTPSAFTAESVSKAHLMAAPNNHPPSNVSQQLMSTVNSQNVFPLLTPAIANPVLLPNAPSAVPVMPPTLNTFTSVTPNCPPPPPPVQSIATPKTIVPVSMTVSTNSTVMSTNQTSPCVVVPQAANLIQQENEQFALNWIRATLEVCPTPGRGIDQAELYKLYMTACARAGRRGVIAPLHFPRCVKSIFGPSVGPKTVKLAQSHGGIAMDPPTQIIAYEGIQVRSKPLPIPISAPMVVSQSTSLTTSSIPTSPILKAQLSAPTTNSQHNSPLIKREILGKTIQSPALPTNVATETSVITTAAAATMSQSEGTLLSNSNTSLIKTLLASKVCDPKLNVPSATIKLSNNESCTLYASSQNCNSTVITEVTQRQQQQKIRQQQFNSTSALSSGSSLIMSKQTSKINGIRTTASDEVCKNDTNVVVTKPELQPSVITTVTSNNKMLVNSFNKLCDKDQSEMNIVEPKIETVLNGTPEVSEVNDITSKSIMLSGLLDKEIEKKDAPFLYGTIQVGDNGLELNGACSEVKEKSAGSCIKVKQESEESKPEQQSVKVIVGGKRTSEELVPYDQAPKKPHLNGNSCNNDEENLEIDESNMKASTTAANLYAALAADVLEDIDGLDDEPPKTPVPQQQVQVSTQPTTQQVFQSPGQIIVSSSNPQWTSNNQRGIVTMVHQSNTGGQQYVLTQSQSALVQGQGQTVLVAQTTPQGSGAKTIIILQQPTGNSNQSPNSMTLSQSSFIQSSSPSNQSKVIMQRFPTPSTVKQTTTVVTRPMTPVTSIANKQQVKVIKTVPHIISAPMPTPTVQTKIRSTTPMKITGEVPIIMNQGQFLCEWRGCMRNFKSANEVYMHACESHCPSNGVQEMQCLWERCDAMKRKRFSLMTHLFDRHCNPDVLRMMAVRRKQLSQSGRSEIPPPAPPAPHPGYAPNAAFNAIKRHALEFVNPKELQQRLVSAAGNHQSTGNVDQDDNEGPVTKSIRLTSALILRNLVIYSSTGRWHLRRYEAHLSNIALSNVESSRTISQLLFDLCHSS